MRRGVIVATCMAIALPAYAQTGTPKAPQGAQTQSQSALQGQTEASAATRQFVEKVAISDMFELQSNKMALDKSKDDAVQRFARQMVDDHTKTSSELKSMAQQIQGIKLPDQMDKQHQQKLEQLKSADGRQFYQLYRTQQIEAHQSAIRLFDDYAKNGDMADLKAWAQKTLPALQQHLQHAQALPQNPAQVGQAPAGASQNRHAQTQHRTQAGQKTAPLATASSNHIMASDLRGTTVYGANEEKIGEIDDIVLQRDGEVAAVVVGVGGFLGIGEKKVAIPFEALDVQARDRNAATTGTMRSDQNRANENSGTTNPDRIVLRGMTKQDLEAAPAFKARGN